MIQPKLNIIIIDSSLDELHALIHALESADIQVTKYADPQVACNEFASGKYHVAIVKIHMPKLTGFEVYRRIRKIDPRVHVVFLTSFDIHTKEFGKLFPSIVDMSFIKLPVNLDHAAKQIIALFQNVEEMEGNALSPS